MDPKHIIELQEGEAAIIFSGDTHRIVMRGSNPEDISNSGLIALAIGIAFSKEENRALFQAMIDGLGDSLKQLRGH